MKQDPNIVRHPTYCHDTGRKLSPMVYRCPCGRKVELWDANNNYCHCGRLFNSAGQEVLWPI